MYVTHVESFWYKLSRSMQTRDLERDTLAFQISLPVGLLTRLAEPQSLKPVLDSSCTVAKCTVAYSIVLMPFVLSECS